MVKLSNSIANFDIQQVLWHGTFGFPQHLEKLLWLSMTDSAQIYLWKSRLLLKRFFTITATLSLSNVSSSMLHSICTLLLLSRILHDCCYTDHSLPLTNQIHLEWRGCASRTGKIYSMSNSSKILENVLTMMGDSILSPPFPLSHSPIHAHACARTHTHRQDGWRSKLATGKRFQYLVNTLGTGHLIC
jgi:hypothetical protein